MTETTSLSGEAAALFIGYRHGDPGSLERLVSLLNPILWHLARSCGLRRLDAEDVVQSAWLQLVDKSATIREPKTVLAWLGTTVRREAWRLSSNTRRESPAELPDDPDPAAGPDDQVVLNQMLRVLRRRFAQLTPRCQALLRVIAQGGRPDYAAICEALDMPIGSIGPTRGRCLAALRKLLIQDSEWSQS